MDIKTLTLQQARNDLDAKKYSAGELTDACLSVADTKKSLNIYLEVFGDVKEQALRADKAIAQGKRAPLLGIPLAIKDNILIDGRHASAASRMLEHYKAPYDATVIAKLKNAGAVFLGRTNMDEFAMGSSTENSAYGPTLNPHDPSRVPGGTSGGSAAAVAAGTVIAALGSDTGGSVRQPASFCGVVGLKPTYGAVSRYGLMAMGSSLDQIGPLGKTVADTELLFSVIAGHDKKDSTTLPEDMRAKKVTPPRRIGVPRDLLLGHMDEDVRENFENNLEMLKSKGYEIVDIALPHASYALAAYYIVMPAEVSTNMARYDGVRFGLHVQGASLADDYGKSRGAGFGPEVRRRILLGTYVLSSGYYDAYYYRAQVARECIAQDYIEAFKKVDLIATPTSSTPAFAIGEKEDPLSMYLADIFTVTANLTGMPAISVPCGVVTRNGASLPLGLQLTAPYLCESRLFHAGKDIESSV